MLCYVPYFSISFHFFEAKFIRANFWAKYGEKKMGWGWRDFEILPGRYQLQLRPGPGPGLESA